MSRILRNNPLWKTVENAAALRRAVDPGHRALAPAACGNSEIAREGLRACSACDGDYEDPDRTARAPDSEDDEGEPDERALEEAGGEDEFPELET
ncbi:MAG: hypothetical protein WA857_21690 [Candidatus Acidiferrum sp.]